MDQVTTTNRYVIDTYFRQAQDRHDRHIVYSRKTGRYITSRLGRLAVTLRELGEPTIETTGDPREDVRR